MEPSPLKLPWKEPLAEPENIEADNVNPCTVEAVVPNLIVSAPNLKLDVANEEEGKPPVFTCNVLLTIAIVESSTLTSILLLLPPDNEPEGDKIEEVTSFAVIPLVFTLTPLVPASNVEPDTYTATVAPALPS